MQHKRTIRQFDEEDSPSLPGSRERSKSPAWTRPPPPGKSELAQTRPPRGRRTPATPKDAPDFGGPLPSNAPGWMRRARRMVAAIERAIEAGDVTDSLEASIERAYAAFELGATDKEIARVAHLVGRAHQVIRESSRRELESAVRDAAEVLYQKLPPPVQRSVDFDVVVGVMRELRSEADGWKAVVEGTCRIFGWTESAVAHSAQAIRLALLDHQPPSSE